MDIASSYSLTIAAIGCMALLMLLQVLIADVLGIKAKHLPGSTVAADHSNLLFRVSRVLANTNESIAIYILAIMFCILSAAPAEVTAYAAWGFVIARLLYACCYYFNLKLMRSVMFGLSMLALASLLVIGLIERL